MPHQPIPADEPARFSGPQTCKRQPAVAWPDGPDVAVIGVPPDGIGWRSGPDVGDLSPPHDPVGMTAAAAASPMFEILSILPGGPDR